MVKKNTNKLNKRTHSLSQIELATRGLENVLYQEQNVLLACLTDNIQQVFFLASELSIEKKMY